MRVSLEAAFFQLLKRFPHPEKLSVRKRFCLAWLRWKFSGKRNDLEAMVELAKEFRVAEGRVGQKRTLIERRARRHFWKISKLKRLAPSREAAREYAKGQHERGEGFHAPEQVALLAERNRANRQKQIELGTFEKVWVITAPDNTEFRIRNLKGWCRENGVDARNLHKTALTGWRAQGYKVRRFDEDLDAHIPWEHELR